MHACSPCGGLPCTRTWFVSSVGRKTFCFCLLLVQSVSETLNLLTFHGIHSWHYPECLTYIPCFSLVLLGFEPGPLQSVTEHLKH